MKKLICAVAALCIALLLVVSLPKGRGIYSFDVSDIQMIEMFTGGVPAGAVRKTVTSAEDIKRLVKVINCITVKAEDTESEPVAGGIGTYFQINMTNGAIKILHIGGNDDLLFTSDGTYYRIKSLDCQKLWNSLNYQSADAGEEGLPKISSYNLF